MNAETFHTLYNSLIIVSIQTHKSQVFETFKLVKDKLCSYILVLNIICIVEFSILIQVE